MYSPYNAVYFGFQAEPTAELYVNKIFSWFWPK